MDDLNQSQRQAVEHIDGPVMIIAGPGTGKTKTLVSRVNYLIEHHGVKTQNILVLTFSRKAANEIRLRLANQNSTVPIHTFHSLALNILSRAGTEPDLIKDITRQQVIKKVKGELSYSDASTLISRTKAQIQPSTVGSLVDQYNQEIHQLGKLDFDDLLLTAVDQVSANPELQTTLWQEFTHILIDEFQDINIVQYELVKLILNSQRNIFVIGDPNQAIYSFRGSNSSIFGLFEEGFPDLYKVYLYDNYRSAINLLKLSHSLFPDAEGLQAKMEGTGASQVIYSLDDSTEADFIVDFIRQKVGGLDLLDSGRRTTPTNEPLNFGDFAVIYRTHYLAEKLKQKFFDSGIPYLASKDYWYEQPKILEIIAAFRYLNQGDESELEGLPESLLVALKSFYESQAAEINQFGLEHLLVKVLDILRWHDELSASDQAVLTDLKAFLFRFDKGADRIGSFLQAWDRMLNGEMDLVSADRVALLSMHASKGLEFKYVFICGFEEGIIPYTQKGESLDQIGEERRLFYVALTRAKHGLYLLSCQRRRGFTDLVPSRFYSDLKQSGVLEELEDPNLTKALERKRKWKIKKSQGSLF
jgi:superfamily I DNA/RNA helicase